MQASKFSCQLNLYSWHLYVYFVLFQTSASNQACQYLDPVPVADFNPYTRQQPSPAQRQQYMNRANPLASRCLTFVNLGAAVPPISNN